MSLPTFDELPSFKNFTGCAWDVWPENDELGTVNLLTEDVIRRAAKEEIQTGKSISLNWPVNFPENPMFHRKTPEVTYTLKLPGVLALRDDDINFNSQSGTQWDGMKHFGVLEHGVYYKGVPADSLPLGRHAILDPLNIDPSLSKLGIQNWAKHGICGRGVLLDLVEYYTGSGSELPYNPHATYAITVAQLEAVAKKQGVQFRQGDILLIRAGFIKKYNDSTNEERVALGSKEETFAGIEQSEDMKRFIWNNHFAAIGSDQPALERWPAPEGVQHLHQTILALWGMPIGEFFDLEELSAHCKQTGRYTFYFSSWPLPIIGGCASPANAAAQF
ncbi:hypothetical protein Hypma_012594 [Hypsizygus marmoreus]|uniref:Cyclase n=1 Tax=Hypsizygus marmoreus TaxID=39966 RepID=A0A369JDY6_HYPMA|nr:hypothetical protein Hypma_012594 [Hypsizygus marmoreus]